MYWWSVHDNRNVFKHGNKVILVLFNTIIFIIILNKLLINLLYILIFSVWILVCCYCSFFSSRFIIVFFYLALSFQL